MHVHGRLGRLVKQMQFRFSNTSTSTSTLANSAIVFGGPSLEAIYLTHFKNSVPWLMQVVGTVKRICRNKRECYAFLHQRRLQAEYSQHVRDIKSLQANLATKIQCAMIS
jgi:hypothetical protein